MVKRALDAVLAATSLVALAPVLVTIALLIKAGDGGPVLYRGARVGRFGRPFAMHKFRTMVVNADRVGGSSTADGDPRVTPTGRFLRKWKLDELPQLFDVLRGEMSLVGPRPETQEYVDLYTEEERPILTLRPGITDWASLWNSDEGTLLAAYQNPDAAYREIVRPVKLKLQLLYLADHSLKTDLHILGLTLLTLIGVECRVPSLEFRVRRTRNSKPETQNSQGDYTAVTEVPGVRVTREAYAMMRTRYQTAAMYASGGDVLEIGCGSGLGLRFLASTAKRTVGGDRTRGLASIAADRARASAGVLRLDGEALPIRDHSFDCVVLYEAIYYMDAAACLRECRRVLRPAGVLLISLPNRQWQGFNASPHSTWYPAAGELRGLLAGLGFTSKLYGACPAGGPSPVQLLRRAAVCLHLIPKSMRGKEWLKRVVYGGLVELGDDLSGAGPEPAPLVPLEEDAPTAGYKVLYAVGRCASG